jgi:PIN domain nuclease of toxin-antitoxin system
MPSGRKGDAPPFGAWRPTARSRFSAAALVDTHIWVWYLDGVADAMSAAALALLRRSVRTTGLLVSDMSIWELGTKSAKGKLTLAPSVADWLARAEAQSGFAFLPLTRPTLLASTQLPGPIHGDPVDRLLVAQAASAAIPLVTADRLIIEYADHTRTLSVCDARR